MLLSVGPRSVSYHKFLNPIDLLKIRILIFNHCKVLVLDKFAARCSTGHQALHFEIVILLYPFKLPLPIQAVFVFSKRLAHQFNGHFVFNATPIKALVWLSNLHEVGP